MTTLSRSGPLLATLLVVSSCALNPARNLRPTSEEPELRMQTGELKQAFTEIVNELDEERGEVADPKLRAKRKKVLDDEIARRFFDAKDQDIGPFRGAEKLDEQDFYTLIEDQKSANTIAASRAGGQVESVAGLVLSVLGYGTSLATVGNYALSGGESPIMPRIITSDVGLAVIIISGLVVGGVGTLLVTDGQTRTKAHLFDVAHAARSFEEFRYGPGGLTPATIAKLEVKGVDGSAPHFCATDEADLKLTALDRRGKPVMLDGRADWFSWRSSPQGLISRADEPDAATVRSPLERSLEGWGHDVTLTVAVNGGPATFTTTMPHDFDCQPSVSVRGRAGVSGEAGAPGREGQAGQDGRAGGDGEGSASFMVEAARVVAPDGKHYALIAVQQEGARETRLVLVKDRGGVTVEATGGRGGRGGHGGSGGRGLVGGACQQGGSGLDGGSGGRGGAGGAGGQVSVKLADRALRDFVTVKSRGGPGGEGGEGGSPGRGGLGGKSQGCKSVTPPGKDGRHGVKGAAGRSGADGRVEVSLAPASSMILIADALAANPGFTLEGAAAEPPPAKPARKR